MKQQILVTGASGYIGSHTVLALIEGEKISVNFAVKVSIRNSLTSSWL